MIKMGKGKGERREGQKNGNEAFLNKGKEVEDMGREAGEKESRYIVQVQNPCHGCDHCGLLKCANKINLNTKYH